MVLRRRLAQESFISQNPLFSPQRKTAAGGAFEPSVPHLKSYSNGRKKREGQRPSVRRKSISFAKSAEEQGRGVDHGRREFRFAPRKRWDRVNCAFGSFALDIAARGTTPFENVGGKGRGSGWRLRFGVMEHTGGAGFSSQRSESVL